MGSSEGSQFLREYPGGIRCLRASASVAFGVGGGGFFDDDEGLLLCDFCGVDVDSRRLRDDVCCCGGG